MTRINANINPADLIDKHLLAEYREIVRIPNTVSKDINYDKYQNLPKEFILGTGHVKYFYDKQKFLHKRFLLLKDELTKRGIVNNITDEMFLDVPEFLYNDIPSYNLINGDALVVERILERISTMKTIPTINNKPINVNEYSKQLRETYGIHFE